MNNSKSIMTSLSKSASLVLLAFSILSFLCLVVFKTDYYAEIFNKRFNMSFCWVLGAVIASLVEGIRFAFLLSSAEDARTKNRKGFFIGLFASIGLCAYELYVCGVVGSHWSKETNIYTHILQFLAVIGIVIELRLVLLLGASNEKEGTPEANKTESTKAQKANPITLGKFMNLNHLNDHQI